MRGFTFTYNRKDIFVETERKNKTDGLASEILLKLNLPDNPSTRKQQTAN